jgi:hypothetical protein
VIKVELKAPKTKDWTLYRFLGDHRWFPRQTNFSHQKYELQVKVQTDAVAE